MKLGETDLTEAQPLVEGQIYGGLIVPRTVPENSEKRDLNKVEIYDAPEKFVFPDKAVASVAGFPIKGIEKGVESLLIKDRERKLQIPKDLRSTQ